MRPLVDAQVTGGGELLATGWAGVRSSTGVDGLVLLEALLPGKALSTDVTHKGFDVGMRHLVAAESAGGGEGALAGVTFQWSLLKPVSSLVDAELPQQPELLVTLVTVQQLVGVLLLGLSQLVAQKVLLQCFGFIEAFVTGRAGERFDMTHHVLLQLVPLVEPFVTELAEEPLLFIQLPPSPPLQLLLLFLVTGCWKTHTDQSNGIMVLLCVKHPTLRIVEVSPAPWSASFGSPSIFSSTSYKTP